MGGRTGVRDSRLCDKRGNYRGELSGTRSELTQGIALIAVGDIPLVPARNFDGNGNGPILGGDSVGVGR